MASIDEAYLDLTGTERLHGPPLGRACAHNDDEGADTAQLLGGDWNIAAGGEGGVGAGEAKWGALGCSWTGSAVCLRP